MKDTALILIAITPRTAADAERLERALHIMMVEDPTLTAQGAGGDTILGAVDEQQLEIVIHRLAREFSVTAGVGRPHVAYRETITRAADGETKYVKQTGGGAQYAHAKIHLYPGERGTGYVFEDAIIANAIPTAFVKPIDDGIREALARGILAGYAIDDVRVVLYDGSYHDVNSSEAAFRIAGAMAFQDAARKGKPVLLEPVMRVDVEVPKEYLQDVADRLLQRGAQIQLTGLPESGGMTIVHARVPLADMFGYASDLRERTRGRASFTMNLDRYEPVRSRDDEDTSGGIGVRVPLQPKPTPLDARHAQPRDHDEEGT